LWSTTAIVITTDEGGGYFDSGYVQLVDFFGDGTRIPLIVVSPYAKEGFVDHTYYDHVSVLKFIERNWGLSPLSGRSRDNLPNPIQPGGTYVLIKWPGDRRWRTCSTSGTSAPTLPLLDRAWAGIGRRRGPRGLKLVCKASPSSGKGSESRIPL
jgi:hypothetical protein